MLKLEESKTESATDRLDKSAWQKAQSVWIELSPNVEAKASAKEAAIDVANKPEDEDAQAAFRNQLKKLLANDQALANRLANILQADLEPDSSAASASEVKTILVLAANPKGTSPLRLGEEVREIQDGLDRSRRRDRFRIEQRWAVRPKDIQRALLDCCPQIVHFSGHGIGVASSSRESDATRGITVISPQTGAAAKYTGPEGLLFEDMTGQSKLVSTSAIANLFALFSNEVECVILNACYSATQAKAIAQHIPYVIGMKKAIGDRAAIKFSLGFYDGLLSGRSVEFAYRLGCNAIELENIPEHLTPTIERK